jgi:thioredoxin-related protein
MKKGIFIISILLIFIADVFFIQGNKTSRYIPVDKFDPNRNAAEDIKNAIIEATKSNRRIILDVGGNWCIWCKRLDTLFMRNKDLAEFMHKNYVVVKINFS